MLLFEKGAMSKPHTDSEKVPGMLATLVISLPSDHNGGTVVLSHEGQRLAYQTRNHEYIAWYPDVVHQVTEVKAGYRWVLTYNLVEHQPGNVNFAAISGGTDTKLLRRIFKDWREDLESYFENDKLIYLLDHKYTDASISIKTLKTTDLARAQRLLAASTENEFSIYLASLERKVEGNAEDDGYDRYDRYGYYDKDEDEDDDDKDDDDKDDDAFHAIDDVFEEEISLTRVVDIYGNEMVQNVKVSEVDIVQEDAFEDDREPDEHAYEGWTGNAGKTATHWYRDTVLVMVPTEKIADFLLSSSSSSYLDSYKTGAKDARVLTILRHLLKRDRECPEEDRARYRTSIRKLCHHIAKRNSLSDQADRYGYMSSRDFLDSTVGEAVKICAAIADVEPLPVLVTAVKDTLPLNAIETLKALIPRVGFENLVPTFDKIVTKFTTLHGRYSALRSLVGSESTHLRRDFEPSDIHIWIYKSLKRVLSNLPAVSNEDAVVLIDLAMSDQGGHFFDAEAVPLVTKHIQNTTFVATFLCKLYESQAALRLPVEYLLSVYKNLLESMLPHLKLHKAGKPQPNLRVSNIYGINSSQQSKQPIEPPREHPIDGTILAGILEQCLALDLQEATRTFIIKITGECHHVDPRDFSSMILPFLKLSLDSIRKHNANIEPYQIMSQVALEQYMLRYVQQEPVQINWARNPVSCSCHDCNKLNQFLRSPIDRVGRFPVGKPRRHHLHSKLDTFTDCTHTTERIGNPQTLIVTKTGKSYEEKLRDWWQRLMYALKKLQDLDTDPLLRPILAEKYQDIVSLNPVRVMTAAPPMQASASRTGLPPPLQASASRIGLPSPLRASTSRTGLPLPVTSTSGRPTGVAGIPRPYPPQIAGQKRKVVVIDLTSDRDDDD